MFELFTENMLSPVFLFFLLGLFAAFTKSDLTFPKGLSEALSIYLLIAIGLKGGIELSHYSVSEMIRPAAGTLLLGTLIPIGIFIFLLRVLKLEIENAAALSASYGSVSIITYGAAAAFLEKNSVFYEGYMSAMVVLLESPAILISVFLYKLSQKETHSHSTGVLGIVPESSALLDHKVLRESLFGKSILLLTGSLLIGLILGERAVPAVKPLFIDLYSSVLILFILNMGVITGKRLPEALKSGGKLLLFGIVVPAILGVLGTGVGTISGLSIGGAALMGVLAGSASYIAAPAAIKTAVPEANPSLYLGLALGITFPFNLLFGIPLYYEAAKWLSTGY
ncbi:sodium-dependent bicarbonate transport family permease [Bacillus lacus]|uniref:Sodium-dependent bicarbonate transport family permease n=1 Tax=Metabacillus lacus TaxID=1983721 RepID=A0A7X2IXD8_9BACI|nr:sodium-dependent bicarbonate transport family permease [Metabacillus lacus]MRX71583.1 sodium-dependent bicarbonate transport family permease [Metabacillus lacus]